MTTAALPLDLFVKYRDVWLSHKFTKSDVFFYLGKNLDTWINALLDSLGVKEVPLIEGHQAQGSFVSGRVYVAKGASIEPTAMIQGPCIIGPDAEVRHGAYIRGNAFIGANAVVGHATEVKSSIFFDGAKAGHFAYVGDSILGRNVNLGAGTKLANLKLKADEISFKHPTDLTRVNSGLRKFGSILGDNAQTGCNAVLSPGSLLLPNTNVMSCVHFHGTLSKGLAR